MFIFLIFRSRNNVNELKRLRALEPLAAKRKQYTQQIQRILDVSQQNDNNDESLQPSTKLKTKRSSKKKKKTKKKKTKRKKSDVDPLDINNISNVLNVYSDLTTSQESNNDNNVDDDENDIKMKSNPRQTKTNKNNKQQPPKLKGKGNNADILYPTPPSEYYNNNNNNKDDVDDDDDDIEILYDNTTNDDNDNDIINNNDDNIINNNNDNDIIINNNDDNDNDQDITDIIDPIPKPSFRKSTARKSPKYGFSISQQDMDWLSEELGKVKKQWFQKFGKKMTANQRHKWLRNTIRNIYESRKRSKCVPKKQTNTIKQTKSKINLNELNNINDDDSTQRGIQNKIYISSKIKLKNIRKFVLDKRVNTNTGVSLLGQSFNNTYRLKHAITGGGGNFPLSKYRFRPTSGNPVVTPRITGLSDNDIHYLLKKNVNIYTISRRNALEGYGLLTKPLHSKEVKVMKKDERTLRRYCNDKEITMWIETHVNHYSDWWDLTFSTNLINKFFTTFHPDFNFNKIRNTWLSTRDPTSFVFVCLCLYLLSFCTLFFFVFGESVPQILYYVL